MAVEASLVPTGSVTQKGPWCWKRLSGVSPTACGPGELCLGPHIQQCSFDVSRGFSTDSLGIAEVPFSAVGSQRSPVTRAAATTSSPGRSPSLPLCSSRAQETFMQWDQCRRFYNFLMADNMKKIILSHRCVTFHSLLGDIVLSELISESLKARTQ